MLCASSSSVARHLPSSQLSAAMEALIWKPYPISPLPTSMNCFPCRTLRRNLSRNVSHIRNLSQRIEVDVGDRRKIGAYYEEKLKSDPGNSLVLRNYGRFSHEVERDSGKAEELYGRAILASPGDGEVLSLYGALIWETERDEGRARSYHERAVKASSPSDSMVLGSYAHFMWEAESDKHIDLEECGNLKNFPHRQQPLMETGENSLQKTDRKERGWWVKLKQILTLPKMSP